MVKFREVIRPPLWLMAFIYFLELSLVLAIWAAFGDAPSQILLAISTLALPFIFRAMSHEIRVEGGELTIGRAHIELKYLGAGELIGSEKMRFLRTQGADPAAYLAISFWLNRGIKIAIKDERDSTPYWLISSKRGKELIDALKD